MNTVVAMTKQTVSEIPMAWESICDSDELKPFIGVCVLFNERPVAVFRLNDETVYAIDAVDPFSGAAVLARGIVGDIKGEVVVASPIYKQHFNLRTGCCLEDESVCLQTYSARILDGKVQLALLD